MPKRSGARRAASSSSGLRQPEKLSEVKAWVAAHGSDPRALAALAKAPGRKAASSAACVRALAAIGGPRALDALATYRGVDSEGGYGDTFPDAVARELAKAWLQFERSEFARRLFTESLWFSNAGVLDSLEGIDAVKDLEVLRVVVSGGCALEPLARCRKLRNLALHVVGDVDLAPLRSLRALATLDLGNEGIRSLDPLRGSPLRRLDVDIGPEAGFDFLADLPRLERVRLSAARNRLNARERAVLAGLVGRGVALCAYGYQPWSIALRRLGGRLTEAAGFRAVGNEDFTETLQLASFI